METKTYSIKYSYHNGSTLVTNCYDPAPSTTLAAAMNQLLSGMGHKNDFSVEAVYMKDEEDKSQFPRWILL